MDGHLARGVKLAQIDRVKELQSYANAVRIVLLGT